MTVHIWSMLPSRPTPFTMIVGSDDVGALTVSATGEAATVPPLSFTLTVNEPATVVGIDAEYVPVEL
jgi:hypothetical protein